MMFWNFEQYINKLTRITIVLKMDPAMSPKRQLKTKDMDISRNIQNNYSRRFIF